VRAPLKVTLHDVAARAGLSIATVSKALNGLPVAAENLERVTEAARALGYVPNSAARALRSDRTQTLGLIFLELSHARGLELLDALSETLEAAKYSLLISTARGEAGAYDLLMRRFLERRVDGLFCLAPRGAGAVVAQYEEAGLPILNLLTRPRAFRAMPLVTPSFASGARAAGRELWALGHRRVGLLHDGDQFDALKAIDQTWSLGRFTIEKIGPAADGGWERVMRALVARKTRPTVLAGFEPQARRVLAACEAAGIAVPDDISLLALTKPGAPSAGAPLSSLSFDVHRFGQAAGETMLAWLAGARPKNRIDVEISDWTARATIGSAP
jgi:LacI family transcriptional regulator